MMEQLLNLQPSKYFTLPHFMLQVPGLLELVQFLEKN